MGDRPATTGMGAGWAGAFYQHLHLGVALRLHEPSRVAAPLVGGWKGERGWRIPLYDVYFGGAAVGLPCIRWRIPRPAHSPASTPIHDATSIHPRHGTVPQ